MKFQAALQAVPKTRENEGFKRNGVPSKYADLSSVVDAIHENMKTNGLAFSQDVTSSAEGVGVTTTLLHESGESMTKKPCWLPVVNKTPQGFGSAITYARRYSLTAALGIVTDDDDDGNAASSAGKNLPKPSGTEGLANKAKSTPMPPIIGSPESKGEPALHDRSLVLMFNNDEKLPVHSLPVEKLRWFATTIAKNIDDPAKSKFREANLKAHGIVTSELAYRGIK